MLGFAWCQAGGSLKLGSSKEVVYSAVRFACVEAYPLLSFKILSAAPIAYLTGWWPSELFCIIVKRPFPASPCLVTAAQFQTEENATV